MGGYCRVPAACGYVSAAFFNHASYRILGLPPMLFGFTLVPIATPIILGALYLRDKKINPQWDEEGDKLMSGSLGVLRSSVVAIITIFGIVYGARQSQNLEGWLVTTV